ncbi:hypothetical protein V1506DRAFT_539671 [Lipomyces tetrasporus]
MQDGTTRSRHLFVIVCLYVFKLSLSGWVNLTHRFEINYYDTLCCSTHVDFSFSTRKDTTMHLIATNWHHELCRA